MSDIKQSFDIMCGNHVSSLCNKANYQKTSSCSIIDVSNDYILIFNDSMRLINLNSACAKTLKDETLFKDKLLGNDIVFFIPELEEPGLYDYYISSSLPKEEYIWEDYNVKSIVNKEHIYVQLKIYKSDNLIVVVGTDITKQKMINELSMKQENRLNELLQEYNNLKITLDVLLNRINEKTDEIEKRYYYNIEEKVLPMLDILKTTKLDERQAAILDILEANFKTIINSFSGLLNAENCGLTQREIQIAHLIQSGKTTKEISNLLCLSCKTVDFHRAKIREKLNIKNTKNNLRATLLTFS